MNHYQKAGLFVSAVLIVAGGIGMLADWWSNR